MSHAQGQIDVIKTLVILIVTTCIFMFFIILMFQNSDLTIDEKKINTQLILNKLMNGKCFSEEFGTIEELKLTQENLNKCFNNINEKILFRIEVKSESNDFLYPMNSKELFNQKKSFCNNQKSSILCSKNTYPIVFIDKNKQYKIRELNIESICS